VKVQQVTSEMAEALGLTHAEGSVVSYLDAAGPARKAGIEVGDVIVRFDDDTPPDERALLRDISRTPEGQEVTVGVLRAGAERTISVAVAAWPRSVWDKYDPLPPAEHPRPPVVRPGLGLSLESVPPGGRAKLGLEDNPGGVLVSAVTPGSDAAQRGLVAGDVILRVQDQPVASPAEVQGALAQERAAKHQFAMLLVLQKERKFPGPSWLVLRLPESAAAQ
jgi:serine protease Do